MRSPIARMRGRRRPPGGAPLQLVPAAPRGRQRPAPRAGVALEPAGEWQRLTVTDETGAVLFHGTVRADRHVPALSRGLAIYFFGVEGAAHA